MISQIKVLGKSKEEAEAGLSSNKAVGLADRADLKPGALSGGQQRPSGYCARRGNASKRIARRPSRLTRACPRCFGRYARLGKELWNDHDCGNARDGFCKDIGQIACLYGRRSGC